MPTAGVQGPEARTTVLVVEDHALLRSVVVQLLANRGPDALEAATGEATLRLAEQQQPHVIRLDLALPGRSGLEVLATLQQQQATTRAIPAIVMSGFRTLPLADQARGAKAAFLKPCDLDAVVVQIRHHVKQRRAPRGPVRAPARDAPTPTP